MHSFGGNDMEKNVGRWILDIVKTVIVAILTSMVLVLVLALIVKATSINETAITYINVSIKIISILIGCLVGFSRGGKAGWLKGLICGVLYVVCSFLVFSFISGSISLKDVTWLDFVTAILVGVISGILTVNVKKEPKIA